MCFSMKRLTLFFFVVFICFSCGKPHEKPRVNSNDAKWMDKFFNELFLEQGAIFVLWGSKPLTIVPLSLFTDEEMKTFYEIIPLIKH